MNRIAASEAPAEPEKKKAPANPPSDSDISTKSVPKKIARFSKLPHVKDKVDAFEKLSGMFTFCHVKWELLSAWASNVGVHILEICGLIIVVHNCFKQMHVCIQRIVRAGLIMKAHIRFLGLWIPNLELFSQSEVVDISNKTLVLA